MQFCARMLQSLHRVNIPRLRLFVPNDLLARSRGVAYPYVMAAKLIASLFTVVALALPAPTLAQTLPEGDDATLVKVIDGDTIKVKIAGSDAEVSVRYIGVDAPEIGNTAKGSTCYAAEATEANRKLIEGHTLRLQRDKSENDRFGRMLRYVYLPDGQMVNEALVLGGYAFAKAYKPDTRNSARFTAAQRQAQTAKTGLWSACRVLNGVALPKPGAAPTAASEQPAMSGPAPTVAAADDAQPVFTQEKGTRVRVTPEYYPCQVNQIKGNRNSMIYHSPGQRDYAYTFKNVQCFDTASQAERADFRAAKR